MRTISHLIVEFAASFGNLKVGQSSNCNEYLNIGSG